MLIIDECKALVTIPKAMNERCLLGIVFCYGNTVDTHTHTLVPIANQQEIMLRCAQISVRIDNTHICTWVRDLWSSHAHGVVIGDQKEDRSFCILHAENERAWYLISHE